MICAHCGATAGDGPCPACGEPPLLDGRYRLEALLGQGAFGSTWRATRVADGRPVCLKELLYHRLTSFEPERMFQREASILRQLSLPGVPRYEDHFAVTSGRTVSLYLAQELIEGRTLAQELEGHRYREDEVLALLAELLGILDGLHRLSPPVVHRDIKPANVIRRAAGPEGGRLVLVDFGSVKDAVRDSTAGGPTVAGTVGYMAPEQAIGQACPASDLYGAGALAVALLTRRSPAELVDDRGELAWEDHASPAAPTREVLRSLLARRPADRPASARDARAQVERALQRLRGEPPVPVAPPAPLPDAADDPFAPDGVAVPAPSAPAVRPGGSGGRWVAGMVVAALVVGGVALWDPDREEAPPIAPVDVPAGILGLRLGMTLAEARAELPEVAAGAAEPAGFVSGDLHSAMVIPPLVRLPGERWRYRTAIGATMADCHLDFAVADGLSRVECAIEGLGTDGAHREATQHILSQLESRYGLKRAAGCPQDRSGEVPALHVRRDVRCTWQDEGEELLVRGSFEDFGAMGGGLLQPRGSLTIVLRSRAHERLERDLRDEAAAEERRRQEADRAERARLDEEERRRIREATGGGRPL